VWRLHTFQNSRVHGFLPTTSRLDAVRGFPRLLWLVTPLLFCQDGPPLHHFSFPAADFLRPSGSVHVTVRPNQSITHPPHCMRNENSGQHSIVDCAVSTACFLHIICFLPMFPSHPISNMLNKALTCLSLSVQLIVDEEEHVAARHRYR